MTMGWALIPILYGEITLGIRMVKVLLPRDINEEKFLSRWINGDENREAFPIPAGLIKLIYNDVFM
jgi:hypothetical protein